LNFEINMPQGRTFNIETGDATIEYRKDILDKYDPDFKQKIIEMEKWKGEFYKVVSRIVNLN